MKKPKMTMITTLVTRWTRICKNMMVITNRTMMMMKNMMMTITAMMMITIVVTTNTLESQQLVNCASHRGDVENDDNN